MELTFVIAKNSVTNSNNNKNINLNSKRDEGSVFSNNTSLWCLQNICIYSMVQSMWLVFGHTLESKILVLWCY